MIQNMNPFFAQIALAVRSVGGCDIKNKDTSNEVSCLVGQIIELSNPVIEGFVKVVEFSKRFL